MILAVASGKGGTGKTTVAVNLALSAPAGRAVRLLDCDVEEPNCHIFLRPEARERAPVNILIPAVDEAKCDSCGQCGRICQYHAIASLKTKPLVFPELCHGCGGCARVCPTDAIAEVDHEIGVVETGERGRIGFAHGILKVGHPAAAPVIRAVKKHALAEGATIVDCPPGTSCSMVAAVRDADFVLLVTEPTPFGLHDLKLAVEAVRELDLSFGVAINRRDAGDSQVVDYCRSEGIRVMLELPEDRRVAEAYSRGEPMVEALPEYRRAFEELWGAIPGVFV